MAIFLALSPCAVGEDTSVRHQRSWHVGRTQASVTQVYTKDPADELERKTKYLDERLLTHISEADGEEIECPNYCVIKFNSAGRFRIQITCRADGNHQIIAFSPRSRSFNRRDFRVVKEPRTLTVEFDSSASRYLVLNCTRGNLFVDALTIEKIEGQSGRRGG